MGGGGRTTCTLTHRMLDQDGKDFRDGPSQKFLFVWVFGDRGLSV